MTYLGSVIGYGTLDPQSSNSEFISFTGITQNTDGSATLTGVTRGLTRTPQGGYCTASTTLAQAHSGQSIFISTSDSPCFFAEYAVKRNDESITGLWHFNSFLPTTSITPTTTIQFATKGYVDSVAFSGAGAIAATEGAVGYSQLATQLQQASSTASALGPLVLQAKYSTSTRLTTGSGRYVTVTDADGYLNNTFLDLTRYGRQASTTQLTVSQNLYVTATSTLSATTTLDASKVLDSSGNPVLWSLLASTTLAASNQSFTLAVPSRTFLRILVSTNCAGAGDNTAFLRFNGDSAINYSYSFATTTTAAAGQSGIAMGAEGNGQVQATVDIFNPFNTVHNVTGDSMIAIAGSGLFASTTAPWIYPFSGTWATSTAQRINSVTVFCGAATGNTAGSNMYIFGSNY
jgi:hypothetical protein